MMYRIHADKIVHKGKSLCTIIKLLFDNTRYSSESAVSQFDCILYLPTEVMFSVRYCLLECVYFVTWCYIRHYLMLVGTFESQNLG
jgi:hypothetical protein